MNKDIVPFFKFKGCKTEKEYIRKYLGTTPTEDAYQLAYDISNDWLKDRPDWEDIETAFKVGVKVGREQLSDELDALNMKYLSQVSLFKSLYEEEKKKNKKMSDGITKEFNNIVELNDWWSNNPNAIRTDLSFEEAKSLEEYNQLNHNIKFPCQMKFMFR